MALTMTNPALRETIFARIREELESSVHSLLAILDQSALLERNPQASEKEVRQELAGILCRCGTHNRIVRAVLRSAQMGGRI